MININDFSQKKQIAILVWIAFSIFYILFDIYQGFRAGVVEQAYISGKASTAAALMEKAEDPSCKPFNVFIGEKKIDLINVACLTQERPTAGAAK
jgi:hypothetical protein